MNARPRPTHRFGSRLSVRRVIGSAAIAATLLVGGASAAQAATVSPSPAAAVVVTTPASPVGVIHADGIRWS